VRLHGGTVAGAPLDASGPVLPGAIQVTPAGEAIILGPDGGVTGGYPVVGVVASADLDRLSLLDVGDRIRFRVIDVPEAARAFTESEDRLRRGPLRPHAIG
jgi:allophanate hydrolase subunit 2